MWNTSYTDANQLFNTWLDNANCTQDTKLQRLACMQSLDISKVSDAARPIFDIYYSAFYFDFPLTYGNERQERLGLAVTDPILVPQAPSDLLHANFTPR